MVNAEVIGRIKRSKEVSGSNQELLHYEREGKKAALGYIDRTYGSHAPKRDDVLFYHGVGNWHSLSVEGRADKIAEAMGLDAKQRSLTRLAASFHDTVQEWDGVEGTWGTSQLKTVARKRFTGANEQKSADFAELYMQRVNEVAGHKVYSDKDKQDVREAIMLTVPKGWDGRTVFTPDFKDAGPIAQAVQLADLAGSGMNGVKMALHEALTLFTEENLDFREDADRMLRGSRRQSTAVSVDRLAMHKARLINWIQRQQSFVTARKERVRGEIDSLKQGSKAVHALFKDEYFDASIQALHLLEGQLEATKPELIAHNLFTAIKHVPSLTW